MKIHVIAVGKKQAAWINTGFDEYAKRLQQECKIQLTEVAANNQSKAKEAQAINKAIPANSYTIALDEKGKTQTSEQFARQMETWLNNGMNSCFLIGGANGLDDDLKSNSDETWSLSAFTLPHGLARVMLAEQIYRAWTILKCHPYHRS